MRLKVAVLIGYIPLTTDAIDQKANSTSVVVFEGKTIAKWLCEASWLCKQTWEPIKPRRLSSFSPTICGDRAERPLVTLRPGWRSTGKCGTGTPAPPAFYLHRSAKRAQNQLVVQCMWRRLNSPRDTADHTWLAYLGSVMAIRPHH